MKHIRMVNRMDGSISRRDETDRWEINTVGLEEEICCEMCENPMRTDRGCDGLCSSKQNVPCNGAFPEHCEYNGTEEEEEEE